MSTDWLPKDAWWNVTAPLTSATGTRTPELLNKIIDQFEVELHPSYKRTPQTTFCNVFCNDVTRALGCEVNHLEIGAGGPRELDANKMIEWLIGATGARHGWTECTESTARMAADKGYPVVVLWYNPTGIGHVAVGTPAPAASVEGKLYIAQAGAANFRCGLVAKGFGSLRVRFFTHT